MDVVGRKLMLVTVGLRLRLVFETYGVRGQAGWGGVWGGTFDCVKIKHWNCKK